MPSLNIRRDGNIRYGRQHVGWIVRHYLGHLLIGTAPYRDEQGRLGTDRQAFMSAPHDRFWEPLTAWTGHLNTPAIEAALRKLGVDLDNP